MLRSVSDISDLTGLSKVSIYNKLKLKEIAPFVIKNKGVTYVDEDGVTLICEGLKLKENALNSLNDSLKIKQDEMAVSIDIKEIEEFKLNLKELKLNHINTLKDEIEILKDQLREKDKQIEELINLNKNNQILLKQQQDKEINQLKLEEHFQEVDQKLMDLREKMESQKEEKKSFFKFLKK